MRSISVSALTAPRRFTIISASVPGRACGWPSSSASSLGAILGALAFRYGISGVYFTLAHHRLRRVRAHRLRSFLLDRRLRADYFSKSRQRDRIDLFNLRGTPAMYYYVILALTALALRILRVVIAPPARLLLAGDSRKRGSRRAALGINTFRWKILGDVISAAMTAVAGVFLAFYYNNLFPEQIFNISRSVEIILGPIIGGMGTLVRPDHRGRANDLARRRRHRIGRCPRLGCPRRQTTDLRGQFYWSSSCFYPTASGRRWRAS